jgi:hypothetical protein
VIERLKQMAERQEAHERLRAERIARGEPSRGLHYVSRAALQERPVDANPSPLRMVAYTDWQDMRDSARAANALSNVLESALRALMRDISRQADTPVYPLVEAATLDIVNKALARFSQHQAIDPDPGRARPRAPGVDQDPLSEAGGETGPTP